MIVYHADKSDFLKDVESGKIDDIIMERVRTKLGIGISEAERRSWQNSLPQMHLVLSDREIPSDSRVSIELQIPQTSKRVDFIVSGTDNHRRDRAVVVEIKQWQTASATPMDGLVRTFLGGAERETPHPSYQAWSYVELLRHFNETVYDEKIELHPCAYLHNFIDPEILSDGAYAEWVKLAPLFAKGDVEKLRAFIRQWIHHGDRNDIIVRIDGGRLRPSKSLAESLAALMEGHREFTMIDEQKVVYETVLHHVRETPAGGKRVVIVHGGPGTGKSVVAVNLLAELTKDRDLAQYVTKNAAPRAVYEGKLTGTMSKTRYSNLFRGSGAFTTAERGTFRALIVDEAHRLNEKSGLFRNLGENQVKELMHAGDVTVFFLDEDQRVTLRDIGTADEIRRWARVMEAPVEELELTSQFRCNGSDGYLAWVDHILGVRETANTDLDSLGFDFDFRVCSTPKELRELIEERNRENQRSRLVAGYCWDWKSKKDPNAWDVVLPEHDFRMRWNLNSHGPGWMTYPDSIREIGCIHTCQGLELDHVGVIFGEDLVVRDGRIVTQPEKRSRNDSSIRGYKKMLREDPDRARREGRAVVLNTYRTLMTRGLKGCYVYAVDPGLEEWLKEWAG